MNQLKQAAVMLIVREDGMILGVTRKNDHTKFGLPGGHVEPNEDPKDAAIRETFEETGIRVYECEYMYDTVVPGLHRPKTDFHTHYFKALSWSGDIVVSEEGLADWVTADDIVNGCYSYSNTAALKFAKII
jgi:8-oxo-dGTP pyrophosphatase MutT (NUDIX family)